MPKEFVCVHGATSSSSCEIELEELFRIDILHQ